MVFKLGKKSPPPPGLNPKSPKSKFLIFPKMGFCFFPPTFLKPIKKKFFPWVHVKAAKIKRFSFFFFLFFQQKKWEQIQKTQSKNEKNHPQKKQKNLKEFTPQPSYPKISPKKIFKKSKLWKKFQQKKKPRFFFKGPIFWKTPLGGVKIKPPPP